MQSAKDYLQTEIKKRLDEAKSITDAADAAARSITADEREKVSTLLEQAEGFKQRVSEMEENENLRKAIEKSHGAVNRPSEKVESDSDSLAEAFLKSDGYRALKANGFNGQWSTGAIDLPYDGAKATVTTTASPIGQPDVQGGVKEMRLRRLTVADLLASGSTTSGSIVYAQQNAETNAAAPTAEGDPKPEGTITLNTVTEAVRKIATFLPVSDEMLEDESQIRSFLENRLRLHVQHTEEAQLLTGGGTAPALRGLLNRTGIQTATRAALQTASGASNSNAIDAIYQAFSNVRAQNAEPDGVVMHPTNWNAIRLAKNGSQDYYGGGPFTQSGIYNENLWGVPVVVTSAITEDTALVGAFGSEAQLFRRSGLTVEASNSHSDFFQRNLTAIRAETRLALAVYRPAAFHAITAFDVDPI